MLCSVKCLHLYSPRLVYPQSPACRSKPYLARLDKPNDLSIEIKAAKHQDFHQTKRRCGYYDVSNKLIPYMDAWTWQKQMVEAKHALMEADEDVCDTVVILQHPPVYTLGTRSSDKFLHFDIHSPPYDIYRTERGGEVTYHGPGQLVMYPIMNLHYHKMDLHWYLRSLEEVIIRALWSAFSLKACRIDGLTGVWVGSQKVAAIGIRVSRWVTYHGLAINVTTDLTPFTKIVPCGISDRSVGSLFEILKSSASLQHVASPSLEGCEETWNSCTLLDLTCKSLLKEFSEVFQVDLIPKSVGNLSCISTSNILEPLT